MDTFDGIEVHSFDYWSLTNPILGSSVIGYDTDADMIKVGDGVTEWNDLPYSVIGEGSPPDPPPPSGIISSMSAYLGSNQIIQPSTWTKVQCNMKRPGFDALNEYDLSTFRYTPKQPGPYLATACVTIVQMQDGSSFEAAIMKNRTVGDLADEYAPVRLHAGRNDNMTGTMGKLFYMDGIDDYLELFVYQNTGIPRELLGHPGGLTSFEVMKQ